MIIMHPYCFMSNKWYYILVLIVAGDMITHMSEGGGTIQFHTVFSRIVCMQVHLPIQATLRRGAFLFVDNVESDWPRQSRGLCYT